MKKAYELTTLTGTQALLLIASETGHVYTFATPKLQPFVTHHDGKALIQRCLNSDLPVMADEENSNPSREDIEPVPPVMASAFVESSLVLVVGKIIPVIASFNASLFRDLCSVTSRWSQQTPHPVVCLAGGCPSNPDAFRAPNDRICSDIVVGLKMAEVDYTSSNQPPFSIEKLRVFLEAGYEVLTESLWREIAAKQYVLGPSETKPEYFFNDVINSPVALYIVSTYPNAFVNVVFGVHKQGANGKGSQVVGISCHTPDSHVCRLDIDDTNHLHRINMMTGVEGVPYYHLLPEIFK